MPDALNMLVQALAGNSADIPQLPPRPSMPTVTQAGPLPAPNFQKGPFDLTSEFIKYPALRGLLTDLHVIDSRGSGMGDNRQLEWYPPDERDNPHKGTYTAEIFNPRMSNGEASSAISADALHGLKDTDPQFAALRRQFLASLTPQQLAVDQRAYAEDRRRGETRNFAQWMQDSRGDAYLRGYLFPDRADEWRKQGTYTPRQQQLLERMRMYLEKGQ